MMNGWFWVESGQTKVQGAGKCLMTSLDPWNNYAVTDKMLYVSIKKLSTNH